MQTAPSLVQITTQLAEYSAELAQCIRAQLWTETDAILTKRQQFFESLDVHIDTLKAAGIGKTIQQTLLEDEAFIADILAQKHQLEHEHLVLVRGRQAIKSYELS